MTPKEGMQRLRAERRKYGLCRVCGAKLPDGFTRVGCDMCLAQEMAYRKRRREKLYQKNKQGG